MTTATTTMMLMVKMMMATTTMMLMVKMMMARLRLTAGARRALG